MYGVLFSFPTATDTINQIGAYSSPWFTELWPYVAAIAGIAVVFFVIRSIFSLFHTGHH